VREESGNGSGGSPELIGVAGECPRGAFQDGEQEWEEAGRQQQIGDHRGNLAHAPDPPVRQLRWGTHLLILGVVRGAVVGHDRALRVEKRVVPRGLYQHGTIRVRALLLGI